jgi:hypothetical protein
VLDFSTAELADTTRPRRVTAGAFSQRATRPNALNLVVIQWLAAGALSTPGAHNQRQTILTTMPAMSPMRAVIGPFPE